MPFPSQTSSSKRSRCSQSYLQHSYYFSVQAINHLIFRASIRIRKVKQVQSHLQQLGRQIPAQVSAASLPVTKPVLGDSRYCSILLLQHHLRLTPDWKETLGQEIICKCSYATLLSQAQKKLCNLAAGGQAITAEMLACLTSQQDKSACTQLRAATAVLFLATKPASFRLQSGAETCVNIQDSDKKAPTDFLFALSRVKTVRSWEMRS